MENRINEESKQIQVIERDDCLFPERLREISGGPKRLYVYGKLPSEEYPSVAIIGARDCSEYGKFVAMKLGSILGRSGIQVISGMARGIDGIAQKAALDVGGYSLAVLGSGVDVCYPSGNRELYERLKHQGGIISEYEPGTKALPGNFPPRNRIVSGLADAVVVVEARLKSGTLITVDMALEQGREVYAIPGRVTDRLSDGCNKLIKYGAIPVLDYEEFAEDVWEVFRRKKYFPIGGLRESNKLLDKMTKKVLKRELERPVKSEDDRLDAGTGNHKISSLSPELRRVYETLDYEPKTVEMIRAGLPEEGEYKQIIALLMQLCLENVAVQVSPGKFCVKSD